MTTLLAIHAHPDDESSKGAGTIARYAADGVRCVLVTVTGGEAGDILNPALDTPDVKARLTELRHEELMTAAKILGYEDVIELGYRDSGMPDTDSNAHPDALANADFAEVLGRIVTIVRRERPAIVLGYDDHERYPHPDHLVVHRLSLEVFDAAADGDRFPDAGPPWQIERVYAPVFTVRRIRTLHEAALERGLESPFERWMDSLEDAADEEPLVRVDVGPWVEVGREALRAHRTQVDPDGLWFKLPTDVVLDAYPYEDFEVLRATSPVPDGVTDLLAGL
jgi:mycothiol S-conjugate amidase